MASFDLHVEAPSVKRQRMTHFDVHLESSKVIFNKTIEGRYRDGKSGYEEQSKTTNDESLKQDTYLDKRTEKSPREERLDEEPAWRSPDYDVGQKVNLREPRVLAGPWTVKKINGDGTYDLEKGDRTTRKGLLFSSPAQRASTDDDLVHLYSKERIDILVRLIITIFAVALLMAPVVVLLSAKESGTIKIVVVLLFTLFFSAALSVFTKAKRHEVFAATAA
ncbi:hypothetical protein B0A49_08795 [Cryomyces minteri]|uniref:DUF6594 domain-containing protein n=1 Tax=Cryomyces minteri TaxID=331657 RepID=A0A4U0WUV4_9PEZI|nr:hypothetical protein B0A49_08795 [Cryomyces minteri]